MMSWIMECWIYKAEANATVLQQMPYALVKTKSSVHQHDKITASVQASLVHHEASHLSQISKPSDRDSSWTMQVTAWVKSRVMAMANSIAIANPINDPMSPYYMSLNENPGAALVTPLLTGSNYHSWTKAMMMALKTKTLLHLLLLCISSIP
ncbi:hypothetical protein Lal_00003684 [Lupinus albus]|nr:hypothetical protein Lal_00003684 [Lupinus albus]